MPLLIDIKGFWRLGQASGTRFDDVGDNDLSDQNTVTSNPGIVGDAAQFVRASNEFLRGGNFADLTGGDTDFSISTWVYLDSKPSGIMPIVNKYHEASNNREYQILWNNSSDRFEFRVSSDGLSGTVVTVVANNFGAPSIGVLIHIIAWHDSVANTINIQINDGTVDSVAHTPGVFVGVENFNIGADSSETNFYDGRIDATGFWRKVLTGAEQTELNNSGNGVEYGFDPPVFQSRSLIAQP